MSVDEHGRWERSRRPVPLYPALQCAVIPLAPSNRKVPTSLWLVLWQLLDESSELLIVLVCLLLHCVVSIPRVCVRAPACLPVCAWVRACGQAQRNGLCPTVLQAASETHLSLSKNAMQIFFFAGYPTPLGSGLAAHACGPTQLTVPPSSTHMDRSAHRACEVAQSGRGIEMRIICMSTRKLLHAVGRIAVRFLAIQGGCRMAVVPRG